MKNKNTSMMMQALLEIRKLKAELKTYQVEEQNAEIAIVGMGCKFPGDVSSPQEYWQLILDKKDGVTDVPETRWNRDAFYSKEEKTGKVYTDQGGFINDVDKFDPFFFGIAPREAEFMDPQHRLLLEVCWESLENAGVAIERSNDLHNTGVFVGLTTNDYLTDIVERHGHNKINSFYGIGNAHNAASGRISHTFGFTGPSISIDTACSSSLTSIHLACQSLQNKECNMAIAGGVNALLNPMNSIVTAQAQMLSPEGRCKTFDDSADGYIRSEGCGAIVLMRLSDALAQSKNVLAVIKGSGVNHNATSSSITVPNMKAQSALIEDVLRKSKVKPADVSYIEAHGTGTNLGDPIELRALQKVFGKSHDTNNPLYIGAVKSNIGHTESAAGVAGVIKSVLSIQNKTIPGNIHFTKPNTNINWEGLPFVVPTDAKKWDVKYDKQRLAGISSFGVSGTNAHILLGEFKPEKNKGNSVSDESSWVFSLSAKSSSALEVSKSQMLNYIKNSDLNSLKDLCVSSTRGRSHFEYRFAEKVSSFDQLKNALSENKVSTNATRSNQSVVFNCLGSKSGLREYASDLYKKGGFFTRQVNVVDALIEELLSYKLSEIINIEKHVLSDIDLFCLEFIIAKMWNNWGVNPITITGVSQGLFTAAALAGHFGLSEGIKWLSSGLKSNENVAFTAPTIQLKNATGEVLSAKEIQSIEFWDGAFSKSEQAGSTDKNSDCILQIGASDANAVDDLNQKLVNLYLEGVKISFAKVYEGTYNQLNLPNYPFEKERYWLEGTSNKPEKDKVHPFCEEPLSYAKNDGVQIIENNIGFNQVSDHCIHNKVTIPGAAYVEILLGIGKVNSEKNPTTLSLKNISFTDTVLLENQEGITLQSVIESKKSDAVVSIYYPSNGEAYKLCSSGTIVHEAETIVDFDIEKFKTTNKTYLGSEIYSKLKQFGYAYGESYQGIKELSINGNTVVGTIEVPNSVKDEYQKYVLHPALLDACLQLAGGELIQREKQDPFVPVFIGSLTIYSNPYQELKCHVELQKSKGNATFSAVYHIYNEKNEPVAVLKNVIFRQLEKKPDLSLRKKFYTTEWNAVSLNLIAPKKIKKSLLISKEETGESIGKSILNEKSIDFVEVKLLFSESLSEQLNELLKTESDLDQIIIDFTNSDEIIDIVRMQQNIVAVQNSVSSILLNSKKSTPELVLLTSLETEVEKNKPTNFQNELLALTSVLNQEEPGLKARLISIDPKENTNTLKEIVFSEYDLQEEKTAIFDGVVYTQRLQRLEEPNRSLNKPYKLKIDEPGSFSDLEIQVIEKAPPASYEVGLSVVASGVNFKEVLYALGALPMPKGDNVSFEFGFECTGIVESIGDYVKDINVGDEVIAIIAPGSLGSYTLVHKNFIFPKPKQLSFEEAATLPIVFITAYYALMNIAKIDASSKVLIHAAAGGVGLAATQIAQLMEAKIFATASTPKHSILKENGISSIYNSRTLDFADQIKQDLNGEGLDVVLNSFSGDFMFKSLDLVKENGCFIEIGKVTQETKDKIKELRPDVSYHNFDIGEIAQGDHVLIRSVFDAVLEKMESNQLKPIRYKAYGMEAVEDAFSTFAKGKNVGKVILTHYQNTEIPLFYPEEHYLITGGNGGLGSNLMSWMHQKGAENFIVLSRSGKPESNTQHSQLIENGASIRYEAVDVANEDQVKAFFENVSNEYCNLRGVFHTAGVLNDSLIANQTNEDIEQVLSPKLNGTSYLDQYSRVFNLKHFVCFSSVASIFGGAGQCSYAGANGAMDTIVKNRRRIGLSGTTLNWGPFADVGMASTLKMQSDGITKLTVTEDFEAIEIALRENIQQLCIADVDWKQLAESSNYYRKTSLLEFVRPKLESSTVIEVDSTLDGSQSLAEQIEQTIKSVLGLSKNHAVSRTRSLFDYGLDSLMAVELKNRIEKLSGQEIGSTFLFNNPTLEEIAQHFNEEEEIEEETNGTQEVEFIDSLSMLLDEELKDLE